MKFLRWPLALAIIASFLFLAPTPSARAVCSSPIHTMHCDYWQPHTIQSGHIGDTYWTLDGYCDTDCNGNVYCEGDTTYIQNATYVECQDGDPCCEIDPPQNP